MSASLEVRLPQDQEDAIVARILEGLRQPEPDRWLDARAAAKYTGKHPVTIRRHATEGKLAGVQESERGRWAFRRSDLDAYMGGAG